jgi:hypothetical protein
MKPLLLLFLALCGCAPQTPGTYVAPWNAGVGFFGAQVNVGQPGYTVPAKVVPDPTVITAVLKVPPNTPITSDTVPVVTASGVTTNVPVVVAAVPEPVLAVPAKAQ